MNKNDIWNLFKMTGKIEYFVKYKEMTKKGIDYIGNNESKGNNN
jgi:hypothetical protein